MRLAGSTLRRLVTLSSHDSCIEQQEIDRPTSLDEFGEDGLNAGQCVQLQLQRREDL